MNLSLWFEKNSPREVQFTQFTRKDFENIKSLGADVIRLPIRLHKLTTDIRNGVTNTDPDYTIDPLILEFLDSAVDWAEELGLYIILDNHSFDPAVPTEENIEEILLKVWGQMAEHFKDRSRFVMYEILNEPHGISEQKWGEVQGRIVEAIRKIDPVHTIIVGAADFNSLKKIFTIPRYDDQNLIYTFHFYEPMVFTHQGANWGEPHLTALKGIPFPMESRRMPETPEELKGTWVEWDLNKYEERSSLETLDRLLDIAANFSRSRNVPVFCGEFGVFMMTSREADRVRWYRTVRRMLEQKNIAWTSWDYFDGFGLFKTREGGDFPSDLNTGVVKALGFKVPPKQKEDTGPVTSGFAIYDDYTAPGIDSGFWKENGSVDFYYPENTGDGRFAIQWGNCTRYGAAWFEFRKAQDLSRLAEEGYALEFMARADADAVFEVRFINPDSLGTDIPWRVRYIIDSSILPPDGQWHKIRIPLNMMQDSGAWSSLRESWYDPAGYFSWEKVKRLEFSAEEKDLIGTYVCIDAIHITK
ncbi:glycoside hydrolase family 5 protein [Brucepastera parasyntrophica]|uniref:glycoside hydrolase family 5 protein n=1 Tax=Brucepastera parasyntrophica TaxID=2880008 RepID=UPI00210C565A|nr:glycoside hydrolase family 5 protein [Brucepastera parasyntrophica]ULQ58801.1 glycoside hydrolase family 5 protein [Brucepastera parasyntrophica]